MTSRLLDSPLQVTLSGVQLMEASAGTGKTWTLSSVYVLLILGHGALRGAMAQLMPQDILVVTFTNAAAAELRDRIRKRLEDTADAFRTGSAAAEDSFLQDLLQAYPDQEQRLVLSWRLRKASEAMDEAAIHTIHGWCQQVLAQHAFDSGAGFHRTLETRKARWWRECAQDYWRTHVLPLPLCAVQLYGRWWSGPDRLMREVLDIAARCPDVGSLPDALSELFSPLSSGLDSLREAFLVQMDGIETSWRVAVTAGVLHRSRRSEASITQRWESIREWALSGQAGWPVFSGDLLKDLGWWGQTEWAKVTTGKREPPVHPWFDAVESFVRQWDAGLLRTHALAHAHDWMKKRMADVKEWRGWMDFDDLIKDVHAACTSPDKAGFRQTLARRHPVAMIDEFQDTDALQYGIFSAMHQARPDGMLLMIGDPKQAIYAFRGADIHTYLRARQEAAGNLCSLAVNHRSTHDMVAAVNAFFTRSVTAGKGGAFLHADIPFVPVTAKGTATRFQHAGENVPALTIWHVPGDKVDRQSWRHGMAAQCAWKIASLLDGPSFFLDSDGNHTTLAPSGIAVLVRSGAEAALVADELSSRGVRTVFLSERTSIFACPEASSVLAWLSAVANPADEAQSRRALADAALCLSVAELDFLQQDDHAWEAQVQRFRHWLQVWQNQGVMPMLRDFLRHHGAAARLLASGQAGERRLTNILQLAEWLQEQSVHVEGERALMALLEDAIRQAASGDENEEDVLRLESDEKRVRIITLHKSKGLEYDLVFMPFVADAAWIPDAPFRFHAADGSVQTSWCNVDCGDGQTVWQKAVQEQLAEDIRLLYVGLTRARHACWMGVAAVESKSVNRSHAAFGDPAVTDAPLAHHALAWLLGGQSSLDGSELATRLDALAEDCSSIVLNPVLLGSAPPSIHHVESASSATLTPLVAHRSLTTRWSMGSFSSWAHGRMEVTTWDVKLTDEVRVHGVLDHPVDPPSHEGFESNAAPVPLVLQSYPAGSVFGDLLHKVLEAAAERGFPTLLHGSDDAGRLRLVESVCSRHGRAEHALALAEWLPGFLATPIGALDGYGLGDICRNDYLCEMKFWFEFDPHDLAVLDAHICASEKPEMPRARLQSRQVEGMLTGAIDLVIRHHQQYFIVDYKSNRFEGGAAEYEPSHLWFHILEHRYDLQYVLYTLALHRHLSVRLGASYDYDTHVGGAIYLFVRGMDGKERGVFYRRVPKNIIETLDSLMGGMQ